MTRKNTKLSTSVVFFTLLLLGNVLLFVPQDRTKALNFSFLKTFGPILNPVPRTDPSQKDTIALSSYNKLWKECNNLKATLAQVRNENRTLTDIRTTLPSPGPAIIIAKIVKASIDGQRSELIINKGKKNGLALDQYVLSVDSSSVLGTIYELTDSMARVQLVTDSNHHIPVQISRQQSNKYIPGQLTGNNENAGKIPHRPTNLDIKAGDAVYADARPGLLDILLVIGKIAEVKPDYKDPLLWDITVEPIDNIKSLKEVAVVIMNDQRAN